MIDGQEEKKAETAAVKAEAKAEAVEEKVEKEETKVELKTTEDEVKKATEEPKNEELEEVQIAEAVPIAEAQLAKEESPAVEEAKSESPAKEQLTEKTSEVKTATAKDGQTDLEMGTSASTSQEKPSESEEPALGEIFTTVLTKMNANGGWAWFALFCSVILMIDASTVFVRMNSLSAFAVSFSVINICASLTYALLAKYEKISEKPRELFVVIFYMWVLIGVGVMTFSGPFLGASNGYFAAWGTLFAAHMMIKKEIVKVAERIDSLESKGGYLFCLFFSSCVNMFAGVGFCSRFNCSGFNGWNLAVGLISALLCVILQVVPALGTSERKGTFVFLIVWWIFGVALLTFPLVLQRFVGNAYFSAWASLAFSCILLFLEMRKEEKPTT